MRILIILSIVLWALPTFAQDSYTARFRNPGETLTLDFLPVRTAETPEDRHAKIDTIWADILRTNGYWTIGTPTKTATGMVMAIAYNPQSDAYFHYQILYSWDYRARISFIDHAPGRAIDLRMDLSAFRSLTISWEAPAYCTRTAPGGYFTDVLSADQKRTAFEQAGCDPRAYERGWQADGSVTFMP